MTTASMTRRTRTVWAAFAASMSLVGGLLLLVDGPGTFTTPELVSTEFKGDSIDVIFDTRTPTDTERWNAIVIHHSGSQVGTPESIASEHRAIGLQGLGHHFIVGNGNGLRNGQIHVGYRWDEQLPGAHVGGPNADEYNLHAIGICLVGVGDRHRFTEAQLDQLVVLIQALQAELGIPDDRILLHRDVARTSDPGIFFPIAALRERL